MTEAFRFSKSFKWWQIFGIVFCAAAIVFFIAIPSLEDLPGLTGYALTGLGLCVFGALLWRALHWLRMADDYVQVDEQGISYVSPQRSRLYVQWRDIGYVKARDLLQRLELYDALGRVTMRLEYRLENFELLRSLIRRHAKPHPRTGIANTTFTGGNYAIWIIVACSCGFLVMAALSALQGEGWIALGILGFAVVTPVLMLFLPRRLKISSQGFVIAYPIHVHSVAFDKVVNIQLKNELDQRGNIAATVHVDLVSGKCIMLFGYKEGSYALYQALKSAWTAYLEATTQELPAGTRA